MTHQEAACNVASMHFGPTLSRIDIYIVYDYLETGSVESSLAAMLNIVTFYTVQNLI